MSWSTKRILTVLALIVAAAWFSGLREIANDHLTDLPPGYRGQIDELDRILDQGRAMSYTQAALRSQFGKLHAAPLKAEENLKPVSVQVGEQSKFWVSDGVSGENYQVTATLRFAGEQTLMYVDNQIEIDLQALEQAARDFETSIYPQTRALFGAEASHELDGDSRLAILHTPLSSAGGYYSHADSELLEVNRFSNQREMFVIGSNSYLPGEDEYLMILAHEFQHMIHANQQPDSPAWFNEGLSMLAQDLNGYVDDDLAMIYLANPDISLTDWSYNASETGEHYGAAQLFLRYFYQQYGGVEILSELIRAGAGSDPQVFSDLAAETRPDVGSFIDLVVDWAVANLVDDASIGDGRYSYDGLPGYVTMTEIPSSRFSGRVNQLGVDYLGVMEGPILFEFDGEDVIALTGAHPKQGDWMWWSGRGDARVSTLTRAFDLVEVQAATLQFSTWYEIEHHFDYAYVTVSIDGGQTWQTLRGQQTSTEDPQGSNLGNGLTGVSGRPGAAPEQGVRARWVKERMDLTPYAGRQILLRFWMVTDPAYNAQGFLLDDIHIQEIGYYDGGETGEGGWQSQGFVLTTGGIPQEWALRLVVENDAGLEVHNIELDPQNQARIELDPGERGVLVVIGASPLTDEPAYYRITTGSP
jgi:immune inhibitor A